MSDIRVESMGPNDWEEVAAIYLDGIASGHATFETSAPSFAEWDQAHLRVARIVARRSGVMVGWAALSPFSRRSVYAGVAEVSVYVAASDRGTGVGRKLLTALIDESEQSGIWTLQAGIFPENIGSLALHRSCGFREVGRRERIGKLKGIWRDTILLERRSKSVGLD